MHTKSGSSIWSRSWTSTGSYCDTNWSHCEHRQTACSESARWGKSQRWRESAAAPPYLLLHRVWQEAAHLPHGLLNLFFCGVLLQEFIHVRHGHLAHLAVGAGFEARLIESNWGKKKEESALWALSTERSLNRSIKKQPDEALVPGCSLGPKDLHTKRVQEEVTALVTSLLS